jgi:hypothetical protein
MSIHTTIRTISIALILGAASMTSSAGSSTLPDQSSDKHLGVASCASSNCHGSLQAIDRTRVLQNEFITWSREDQHSRGMQTLRSEQSKRIASNLGLDTPAENAEICMDCHIDNPAEKSRGHKFTLSDGIGCEACHGGAENWIQSHTNKGRSVSDNVADGMYPTADPESRATLCLSCHMGNDDKFTTHQIMGAGHPRLSFELQTFTELQPAHFRVDEDYKARKKGHDLIHVWITGVYSNAAAWLELVDSDWLNPETVYPELALFDCHACHHPMSDQRWMPRSSKGPPGTARIADSHIMMVWALTSHLQPNEHQRLVSWLHDIHKASNTSVKALKKQAKIGLELLSALQKHQTQLTLSSKARSALLERIVYGGKTGLFDDYAAAEQAAFAVQLLLRELNPERFAEIGGPLFKSVADEDNFNIQQFHKAIGQAIK